jgi:hypothetical protein
VGSQPRPGVFIVAEKPILDYLGAGVLACKRLPIEDGFIAGDRSRASRQHPINRRPACAHRRALTVLVMLACSKQTARK